MNMHASFPAATVSASKRFHAAARPDPIFAKIEAHRAAKQAYADTCSYDDNFPDEITREPRVQYGMYNDGQGNRTPYYLHSKADIEKQIKWRASALGNIKFHRDRSKALKQELLAGLKADENALKKAQDKAGYTAAAEAYHAASAAEDKTYAALLSTTPTTRAGMAALAEYVAENERIWLGAEKESACYKTLKMLAKCALRLTGAELN